MSLSARASESIWLEEPWLLAWVTPVAIVLWAGMLLVFSLLLKQAAAPPPENSPVEARIVEVPPIAGLRSNPVPAHAPAPAVKPKPRVQPRPVKPRRAPVPAAPVPPSEAGTAKSEATPASSGKAEANEEQETGGAGIEGTDNAGARATYAPVPEIPDDLRENIVNTVAVAHFKVGTSGAAEVSLTQPTDNPRLNAIILGTLKEWRFAAATRGGVAVESEFDIRIPITVQ